MTTRIAAARTIGETAPMSSESGTEAIAEAQPEPLRPAWRRWLTWTALIIVIAAAADLLGWDIRGWLSDVWDTITGISAASLVGTIALKTVQTVATAFAWFSILRYAYPDTTRWRDILTGYAVAVGLNTVLPANLGTFMMLVLFSVVIAGASFAGVLGAFAVEKIFFTLAGAFVYLYLFLTVGGTFDLEFAFLHERPLATILLLAAGGFLLYGVARRLWPHVVKWWGDAKEGGAILVEPGKYFTRVFLPSLVGWLAMLGGTAVMLNAYGIPVSFDVLMHVAGGNSVANMTSVTPGGAGVTQAFNVASLHGVTSATTATAYSVASQLISTAWSILFAVVLMIWAWGWTGGKALVGESLHDARRMEAEQREKRRERREQQEHAGASS
jgi:uncharacterized membrane protein YbhN (UPF0104 family)